MEGSMRGLRAMAPSPRLVSGVSCSIGHDQAEAATAALAAPGISDPAISYWTTSTYDAADQQLNEVVTGSVIGSSSISTFQYDANGNRVLEAKTKIFVSSQATYLWDPSNRLAAIQDGSPVDGSYIMTNTYRPDRMRHGAVDSLSGAPGVYVWDQNHVLATVDDTGALGSFFTRGARAVKRYSSPSSAMFYHCDTLGTMQAYSNPDGSTYERVVLEAWGGDTQAMSVDPHSFVGDAGYWGVLGQLHRPLYYVRARWLVAGGPGWLSSDPLPPFGHRYVLNGPTRSTDPSGLTQCPISNWCQLPWLRPPSPPKLTLLPGGPCPNCDWEGKLLGYYDFPPVNHLCTAEVACKPMGWSCPKVPTDQIKALLVRLWDVALKGRPTNCAGLPLVVGPQDAPGMPAPPTPAGQPGATTPSSPPFPDVVWAVTACRTTSYDRARDRCMSGYRCFDCASISGIHSGGGYSQQASCVQECLLKHEQIHADRCERGAPKSFPAEECYPYTTECQCLASKVETVLGVNFSVDCCGSYSVPVNALPADVERAKAAARACQQLIDKYLA